MTKRRIALVTVAALVCLAALAVQSSASAPGLASCGGGVRAALVPCSKAKRIAREYAKLRTHALQGYKCSAKRKGSSIRARCVLDRKRVLFSFRA